MTKLEPLFQKGHFPEAIEALKVGANELKTLQLYEDAKLVLDKIQANILLSSKTATPQDFKQLIRNGVLDASPPSIRKRAFPDPAWAVGYHRREGGSRGARFDRHPVPGCAIELASVQAACGGSLQDPWPAKARVRGLSPLGVAASRAG